MDFCISPDVLELRDQVRDYVRSNVLPAAMHREHTADPLERFPWDWVEELSAMGVRTLALPKEFGGSGGDTLACCILGEELGAGDLGLAVSLDQTWKLTPFVSSAASAEVRDRFLDSFIGNPRFLMASGSSEPSAGSDQALPFNQPGAGARATGEHADGYWILNGEKAPISNGGVAALYILQVRTVPGTGGTDGMTAFYVPADAPGLSVGQIFDKAGQRLIPTAHLVLRDCRISSAHVLGEPGQAGATMGRVLANRGYPQAAATVLGVARAAYQEALEFAQQRVQGGTAIINHQNIAVRLAEMQMLIEAARSLIWRAAWDCDHSEHRDGRLQIQSKVFASEVAFKVAGMALRIVGRWATLRGEWAVDKYLRDAASFLHSDGQNEVLLQKLGTLRTLRAAW